MDHLFRRWNLPGSVRNLLGGLGLVLFILSALSTPQAIQDAVANVPILGQPVPWGLLFAISIILLYTFFRTPTGIEEPAAGRKESDKSVRATTDLLDPTSKPAQVYADQGAMLAAGLGYDDVFHDPAVVSVWVATIAGERIGEMPGVALTKLRKLILANPNSSYMKYLYEARGNRQGLSYAIRRGIAAATEKAVANGASVVLHHFPTLQCLIVFRNDGKNWARWESIVPALDPSEWPSCYITEQDQSGLFQRLRNAFEVDHAAGLPQSAHDLRAEMRTWWYDAGKDAFEKAKAVYRAATTRGKEGSWNWPIEAANAYIAPKIEHAETAMRDYVESDRHDLDTDVILEWVDAYSAAVQAARFGIRSNEDMEQQERRKQAINAALDLWAPTHQRLTAATLRLERQNETAPIVHLLRRAIDLDANGYRLDTRSSS